MKIVFLYSSLAVWGGVERILVDKMNYLVCQYGYDVYMITSDQGLHKIPYNLDGRVHFIDLNIQFDSRFRYNFLYRQWILYKLSRLYKKQLNNIMKSIQPEILVCTSAQNVRTLLKLKGKIPLVVESHINFMHSDTFVQRLLMRWNNFWIGKTDALVTLTEGDAKNWRRIMKDVHVIPNIVHLNTYSRFSLGSEKRVLFVGRFTEQKGIGELFSIWKSVNRKFPDWHLVLYGDGELWDYYKQEAERLNINIELHKPTKEIFEAYCNSSILVLTSLYEPFGLVIPEAMSCGLPVVSYDSPYGPASIISDGVDGFVVPLHNQWVFVDRLCRLISDEYLRREMGRQAIQSSQRFSADKIMPMWKQIYEQLALHH